MDQQIDPNPGGGVDSFRAPRIVGDSSALSGRYGVFFAGQPEVERGAATRGSGCSIPVHQPAGESRVREGRPGDLGGRQEEGIGGTFKNGGRTWRPKGKPQEVNTKDFPSLAQGKALHYGV